jgi:hypothetical protein
VVITPLTLADALCQPAHGADGNVTGGRDRRYARSATGTVISSHARAAPLRRHEGTVAVVYGSLRQAELMRRRQRRVSPLRSGLAGFRFPRK